MAETGQLRELCDGVVGFARDLDTAAVTVPVATRMLGLATRMKNAAATIEALLAARMAEGEEWRRAGHRSAAEHIAVLTGTTVGRAHDALGSAKRLSSLGATADAARSGVLSMEQVSAVRDAATADPAAEQRMLQTAATTSLKGLRDEAARVKAAADPDPDATYRRHRSERELRIWADQHGVSRLFGQTTPDQMATIKAAVETRTDSLFHAARRAGRQEPRAAYMIDALEQICAEWMGATPTSDAPPTEPTKTPASRKPAYLGIVRADLEALRRGAIEGDELCEITGLGPVPVRVAGELLGESVLHLVLTNGSAVGTTVNLKRGPNTAQRIALLATRPGCEITGCTNTFTEIDHDDPWARCQVTELCNLHRYCNHHHDLKSKGWARYESGGIVEMIPPDDPRHPRNHSPPSRRSG